MFNTRLSDSFGEEPHFSESCSLELVGCEFYRGYPGGRVGVDGHWGADSRDLLSFRCMAPQELRIENCFLLSFTG